MGCVIFAFTRCSTSTLRAIYHSQREGCPSGGSIMTAVDWSTPSIVRGACPHDCPDTCAWQVTVENGVAVRLVGDPDHPFTCGGLCAKVNHYLDRAYSSDRVLYPLRRTGPKGSGAFERVSWDQALDDIVSHWRSIIAGDGPTAI